MTVIFGTSPQENAKNSPSLKAEIPISNIMHQNFVETHKEGRKLALDLRSALTLKALDHTRFEEGYDLPAVASAWWNNVQIVWTPTRGGSRDEITLISITTPKTLRNQGLARAALAEFLQTTDTLGLRVNTLVRPKDNTYTQRVTEWFDEVGFTIDGPNCGDGVMMCREAQYPTVKAPSVPLVSATPVMPDLVVPALAGDLATA